MDVEHSYFDIFCILDLSCIYANEEYEYANELL